MKSKKMIRFYNGKILNVENMEITDGEVWVQGDKIIYSGGARDKGEEKFEREINLDGNLIMPSFKNAHTHSAMTFLRSYADDLPLKEWLFDRVFPMEDKLGGEHIYTFTKIAVMEYLSSGITAAFDMYKIPDEYVRANLDCGFRTVLCSSINDFGGTPQSVEEEYLRFKDCSPLISYKLGIHAEYTTKLETIKEIIALCHKYKEPFYMHNSETAGEVEDCVKRYGKTPTELIDSLGGFEYGGGGFHCVWLSDNDFRIFKEKGIWAVTNPGSNTKLASGIADVTRMLDTGINLAIGTDGAASNNALDMFREMYLVSGLQKLKYSDAAVCPADRVLYAATAGSARAMGLYDCDSLSAGKRADLIVIDLKQPNMQPLNNIVKNIVYSGSKQNIRLTMCAGKILYENGQYFIGESAESIFDRANKMIEDF